MRYSGTMGRNPASTIIPMPCLRSNGTMTEGRFYVKDTLSLKAGSSVQGDLFFQRLQVELDAKFTGKCQVIGEAEFNKVSEPMRSLLK